MSDRVLITCPQMQAAYSEFAERLRDADCEVDLPPVVQALSAAELLPIIGAYDGVIAGDDQFTAAVLEQATRLRILSKWGVGTDGIDRLAADHLGIPVTNTPGVFDDEVADVCIGYLVLLARQLHVIDTGVRAGRWTKVEGTSLAGRTLGIVGLGAIGRAVARRGRAMRMRVVGCDPNEESRTLAVGDGVELLGFEEVLATSDYISLNCPLTPETRHLLNQETLRLMRPGSRIVNTGRGQLIDESALVEALTTGQLAGAALDVFEQEPTTADHPLARLPQVIMGSHNASNTREAVLRVSERAVQNLIEGLARSSR